MKRQHEVIPGYDCCNAPCQHARKGDHGICADRWLYRVVTDEGDLELELVVFSGNYPATVPTRTMHAQEARRDVEEPRFQNKDGTPWFIGPNGNLAVYASFPTEKERIGHPNGSANDPRPYAVWSSSLQVRELWQEARTAGQPWAPEPTEALWATLEAKLTGLAVTLRAERADKRWRRCPHCTDGFIAVNPNEGGQP